MAIKQNDQLFDNVNVDSIPDRYFRVLNALNVSIHRCLQKYEAIYQIIAQDKTNMNRSVVLLTWELVDWIDRTKKILRNGAGLQKKGTEYQLLTRLLKNSTELRNVLQHFDKFLTRSMDSDFAPLGAVSVIHQVDNDTIKAMVFNAGVVRSKTDMGRIEIPRVMHDDVDYLTLQIDGKSLNVSEVARKLLSFYSMLRDSLAEEYPNT